MTRQFSGADTRPWYRQFWPWFLILLPASVVVAGLSTLYIANRHADDLVVDDYYKDGLAINRQLEKKQRANVLGITAQLTIGVCDMTGHPCVVMHNATLIHNHVPEGCTDQLRLPFVCFNIWGDHGFLYKASATSSICHTNN